MTMNASSSRGAGLVWLVVALAALSAGGVLLSRLGGASVEKDSSVLATVARENLRVSVLESGQLQAADSIDIYNEIRGNVTVLSLIEEGTWVKKGEVLVELDVSEIEDDHTARKIRYEQANAAFIQAREAKAIQESLNASNTSKAELDLALAETDLRKYLEGDWPLQMEEADSNIALSEMELKNAEKTLKDTRELVELNFEAITTLERDELAFRRAKVRLDMDRRSKEIAEKYENDRMLQVLRSDVDQARAELDRVKRRANADLAQKVADLSSKEATLALEKDKLDQLTEQLQKGVVRAPADGLVVYPVNADRRRRNDSSQVEEGAMVRERQLLISLPDTSRMMVSIEVHESAVDMVNRGQPAVITIDAFPDATYLGKVTFVAPLPDSTNSWLNPDLKVYRAEITLSGQTLQLRPGMSASAEIVIDELKDVLTVPIHACYRSGDHYYVFANERGQPVIREVDVGLHNDHRVEIQSGLEEGEKIYLAVPSNAPRPEFPGKEETDRPTVQQLRESVADVEAAPEPEREPSAGHGDSPQADFFRQLQGLSPEEREKKVREWMESLSPEQRAQMEEMRQRFRGEGGGRGRPGAPGQP